MYRSPPAGRLLGLACLLGLLLPLAAAATHSSALGSALPSRLAASKGKTFYVSTQGSDSAPGSRARPWRTLQHALDRLRPGQRALVRVGTYAGGLTASRRATARAPITLAAAPGSRPLIEAPRSGGDTYGIEITGTFFRLHGFVLERAHGTSSADVYVEGSANHVEISGNEIRRSDDQGVFADPGTHDVQILANVIHDNGAGIAGEHQSHGLYIEGGHDLIANNVIYSQRHGFGIQIYPDNHDSVVVDNTVVGNGLSGIVIGGDRGVSNITVRNNIFAFNDEWGIAHDSDNPSRSIADHNLLFGNLLGGVEPGFGGTNFSGGNARGNPLFLGRLTGNFRLKPSSSAARMGLAAWSMRYDLTGRRRASRPSVGAFEARLAFAGAAARSGRSLGKASDSPMMIQNIRAVSVLRKIEVSDHDSSPSRRPFASLRTKSEPAAAARLAVRRSDCAVAAIMPR
jgi:hypothetical protein